jgi:L-iditol 2-dehydrogenase
MAVTYCLDIAKGFSGQPIEGFNTGSSVVVLGVGPIGLCHQIKARLLGAGEIVAVDTSDFRLKVAADFGATRTLNIQSSTKEERRDRILAMTNGRGADVVIESAGVPEAFIEGLELLRQGGTYIEVGHFIDRGSVLINPHLHICSKNIRMLGQTNLSYTGMLPSMKVMQVNSDKYDFDKIVTHRFGFLDAEKAVLKSMEPDSMKVVVSA